MLLLAGLLLPLANFAQTSVEDLQNAVEIYNAMTTYADGLSPKDLTSAQVADVKNRMDKGLPMLERVIKNGNSEQIKTARYFKTVFQNKYAFVLGMKGENYQCYDVYKNIEREMFAYSEADFPLRYSFFDKNFIINWKDFAATQAEFITSFGEVSFNIGKLEDAANTTRRALKHPNLNVWLRYIAINKMLDIQKKRPGLVPENEMLDLAVQSVKSYAEQPDDNKKTIADNNYPKAKRGSEILLDDARKKNSREAASRCAEVVPVLIRLGDYDSQALSMLEICYKNNLPGDLAFAEMAENQARKSLTSDRSRADFVGVGACDRIAALVSLSDCDALQKLADRYQFWSRADKAKAQRSLAERCLADRQTAAKKAARAAKKANSNFNFYAGIYPLPLLATNAKRDYGGVINFAGSKRSLEFSYLKINRKKENIFDLWIREVDDADQDNLSRWDGFYAHIHPKFFESRHGGYWGFLLGMAQKNFDAMTVAATNDQTLQVTSATFEPSVRQYIGMFSVGAMVLKKGFGADVFWSFGANYSQFDAGTTLDREAYTIDNPLLENRKDSYFGFIMRMGMTIGLNFGNGK